MSKDLKNEYNEMLAGEAPDLWARISQSLPEKSPKKNRTRIYKFAAIAAAACICVAVAVPVVINTTRVNNSSMSSTGTAEAVPAQASYKEEAKTEAFPAVEEAAAEAAAAEPAAAYDTTESEEMIHDIPIAEAAESNVFDVEEDAAEAPETEMSAADEPAIAGGAAAEEAVMPASAEAEKAADTYSVTDVTPAAETVRLSVMILYESKSIDGSALYYAQVVRANASGYGPGKGESISIKTDADTPAASAAALMTGETVIVDLEATDRTDTWILR